MKIGDKVIIATKLTKVPTLLVGEILAIHNQGKYEVGNFKHFRGLSINYCNKGSKSKSTRIVDEEAILKINTEEEDLIFPIKKGLLKEDNHFKYWKNIKLLGKEVIVNVGTGQGKNKILVGVVEKETEKTFTINGKRYNKKDNVIIRRKR